GSDEPFAIFREGNGCDVIVMALEGADFLAGGHVPESGSFVSATSREELTIGGVSDGSKAAGVPGEDANFFSGANFPHACCLVEAGGKQPLSVGGQGRRHDEVVVPFELADNLCGFGVPKLDLEASSDERFLVLREKDGKGAIVAAEVPELLAVGCVPGSRGEFRFVGGTTAPDSAPIAAGSEEPLGVVRKADCGDLAAMDFDHAKFLGGIGVPQTGRVIMAAGENLFAVTRDRDGSNRTG